MEDDKREKKLSVHLVTWNGAKYIPFLFNSLREQTFLNWKLYVWDNASSDGTVEAIKKESAGLSTECEIIINQTNLGFAGGHNALFARASEEYFLLLNQDMSLAPDCIEKMVDFLDEHKETAAVTPRLMKWDFTVRQFTNQIDSLGLKVFRNRRVVEWLAQEEWSRDNSKVKEFIDKDCVPVFGVSGALPMFRRGAIEQVAFWPNEFFDASYHSYKEDVDLAWRLALAGWRSYVLLRTVAYHDRSAAGPLVMKDSAAAENKKTQSLWVRYHSYKNHLMTLYKNEYWQNFALDFPWILWYELKKFAWFLLFDRAVLKGFVEIWRGRDQLRSKRLKILSCKKVLWRQVRQFWS